MTFKPGDLVINDSYTHKCFKKPGIVLSLEKKTVYNIDYIFAKVLYYNCNIVYWNIKNLEVINLL